MLNSFSLVQAILFKRDFNHKMFLFQSEIILLLNVYINRALSEVEGGWRKTFFFRKFCLSPVKKCVVP